MTSTKPLYAVGDIHGQIDELHRALALIEADGGPDAEIVFVGDYTDRGPESRAVIDLLIEGVEAGCPWHCLKGNHDRLFENFLVDRVDTDAAMVSGLSWLNPRLGGDTTLASYGLKGEPRVQRPYDGGTERLVRYITPDDVIALGELVDRARLAVPKAHLTFLQGLDLTHQTDDLFFCHAGIRPGVPLDQQTEDDLIWIRGEFHNDTNDHGPLIVHGHTPVDFPTHFGNRIDIDSGAGYGDPLVPVVFEGRTAWTISRAGRTPLNPVE